MATKPTKIPEWAVNDVVDPTSGQNNVVEPAGAIKLLGWDFKEKPPRQYFNWLARYTYLWCQYLDDSIDQELNTDSDVIHQSVKCNGVTGSAALSIFNDLGKRVVYGYVDGTAKDGVFRVEDNTGANTMCQLSGEVAVSSYVKTDFEIKDGKDLIINTDKFTVDGASGNTTIAGSLDIGSSAFTVSALGAVTTTNSITVGTNVIEINVTPGNIRVADTILAGGISGPSAVNGFIECRDSSNNLLVEMKSNASSVYKSSSVNGLYDLSVVGVGRFGNVSTQKVLIDGSNGKIDMNSQTLQTVTTETVSNYFIMQVAGVDVKVAVVT